MSVDTGKGTNKAANEIDELKDLTLNGVVLEYRELGRGAYGTVYAAKYKGDPCAVKKIHPTLTDSNVTSEQREEIKRDFVRECIVGSKAEHRNIVKFLGVYYPSNQDSFPYLVMELMETSLTYFVKTNQSKIPFDTKISILYDVSLGLSFLHNHQPLIIHRDLSPNNVMLTSELVAKIGDLGVAKVIRADSEQTKSKLTSNPGTRYFMPPEALLEDSVYSTPIDIFSFGGIALCVFSEEWPKPDPPKRKDSNTRQLVALSEAQRRQRYLDKMTGKAMQLRKMVEQCLEDEPDDRPEVSAIIELLKVSNDFGIHLYGEG